MSRPTYEELVPDGAYGGSAVELLYRIVKLLALVVVGRDTGGSRLATGSVPVNGANTPIVAARATRRTVVLDNLDATNAVRFKEADSGDAGKLLAAGDTISLDTTAAIVASPVAGAPVIEYAEIYD